MRASALRVVALLMLPGFAQAATTVYEITGTFGSNEQSCTQISLLFGGADCTFGRNRPGAIVIGGVPAWIGPQFSGGHYASDGIKDVISYVPTSGGFDAGTATFTPAANDGKLAAPITGTFTIDDNGTAGDPTDDLISASFSIGAMARNIATGQSTRAVQRWTTMDHVMAATPVNATATVANGDGGVDYVIGSRGFPAPLCNASNNADCFSTSNSSSSFQNFDANDEPVAFWANIAPNSVGIERSGLLGDPAWTNVQPPPNPPTGNVGAQSTASFTGYSCSDSQANDLDCTSNALVWQSNGVGTGGEPGGFDNMVMKISTNASGAITSAFVYWTEEYAIGFGGPPAGYDNSWQGGTFSFSGVEQGLVPNALDFSASVPANSASNTLDTVVSSVNFGGPVTISIVISPAQGTATVNGNQTINYNATGVGPGMQMIVYEATDGNDTDQGTITITVTGTDNVPNSFAFIDQDGVSISSQVTSNSVTVSGIDTAAAISVSGDPSSAYSVNSGTFSSAAGTISNGDTVRVRHTSSAAPGTGVDTMLSIGGVTDAFTSTTLQYAIDDVASTTMGQPVQIDVLQNDNGLLSTVFVGIWIAPLYGTASVSGAPGSPSGIRITYTPNPDFSGSDSFEYWVESGLIVDYGLVSIGVINADSDGDGVLNAIDNCTLVANANQCDSDGDGYGNRCDGDLTNNGFTNAQDNVVFRTLLGVASSAPTYNAADLNCNGFVNAQDSSLFRQLLGKPPGPSGLVP